jgi:hypothetical protein
VAGTQETLRLAGDLRNVDDAEVMINEFIDEATMTKLVAGAEMAFSKASHAHLMKPIQVPPNRLLHPLHPSTTLFVMIVQWTAKTQAHFSAFSDTHSQRVFGVCCWLRNQP